MSRRALACAAACALVAALAIAQQRVGLAVTVALVLLLATVLVTPPRAESGADGAEDPDLAAREPRIAPGVLALAFAVQPALRDAGPVVVVAVGGTVLAAAWVAVPLRGWRALVRAAVAPARLDAGALLVVRTLVPPGAGAVDPAGRSFLSSGRRVPAGTATVVLRAALPAVVVGGTFALLLGSADAAFADLAGDALSARPDVGELLWRGSLGLAALVVASALAFAALRRPAAERPGAAPPRVEATAAVAALVVVFGLFVAVQLRVLFGGAGYVRATTGLGYGEYAREGFVALVVATGLTLVLIATVARRRERLVRGLLGVLCLLDLVVLASAAHRLLLVVDAYGLTRVRVAGFAVVACLAAILVVVLAAGAVRRVTPHAPAALAAVTLLAGLGFCLANPDARIAGSAATRTDPDAAYLATLSADALPSLDASRRAALVPAADRLRERLRRPDGLAGLNLARAGAR